MDPNHILLLPRIDYYQWVRAAQDYALHFGVEITQDPKKVGDREVVTVVSAPGSYPGEGDILAWLKMRFPSLKIDILYVKSRSELTGRLEERIRDGTAYQELIEPKSLHQGRQLYSPERLYLFWPTGHYEVLQPFGANPELQFQDGLTGNPGLDIRAPQGSKVTACQDGVVVPDEQDGSLRISHRGGYITRYSPLSGIKVSVGDQVATGQVIGAAGEGGFLHLQLEKEGASHHGSTDYPGDVIDPTPFMVYEHQRTAVIDALGIPRSSVEKRVYPWTRSCLRGVACRIGGSMQEGDYRAIEQAGIEAVQVYARTPDQVIHRLKSIRSDMFILARMVHPLMKGKARPEDWLHGLESDFRRLADVGVRYFEIHQSPNLEQHGWNVGWTSGTGFGAWWQAVVRRLRDWLPEARFGFPGLMPGGYVPGRRLGADQFLDGAEAAAAQADWIGVNCFWRDDESRQSLSGGRYHEFVRARFPDKMLMITGFGNFASRLSGTARGEEYTQFYRELREIPGIGAAFGQVLSASGGLYPHLAWRPDSGGPSELVSVLGKEFQEE